MSRGTATMEEESTYRMQLGGDIGEDDFICVAPHGSPICMKRLMDISKKVRNPFQCVGARSIAASADCPGFQVLYAFPQDSRLIRDGADNAAALCAVLLIVQMAVLGRAVMGVDPVPLVGKAAFGSVCVGVCPAGCAADGPFVFGLEESCKYRCSFWLEELLSHETDLIMHYIRQVNRVHALGVILDSCTHRRHSTLPLRRIGRCQRAVL